MSQQNNVENGKSGDDEYAFAGPPASVDDVLKALDQTPEQLAYGSRYKARIFQRLMEPPTTWTREDAAAAAEADWDALSPAEHMDGFENDPEGAADESLSYWGDS